MSNNYDNVVNVLQSISTNGITSYEYIHKIIEMININGNRYKDEFKKILDDYSSDNSSIDLNSAFTAYYSLAFYYKRFDRVKELRKTIQSYGAVFQNQILSNEIESWYFRRIGDFEKAVSLDRNLISNITIEENAGPYISYASSISKLLEKEFNESINHRQYRYWSEHQQRVNDWQRAIDSIDEAIRQYKMIRPNKNYGKHYFIYEKLLMFTPNISDKSIDEINRILDLAESKFTKALNYENENEEDYFKRYEEYRTYQTKCVIYRMHLISASNNEIMEKKLSQLEDSRLEITKSIKKQQSKEIELLSIFTAIISIVLGGVNIAQSMSLVNGIFLLCTLAFIFIAMVGIAVVLSDRSNKLAVIITILAIIIVLSSLSFCATLMILGIAG